DLSGNQFIGEFPTQFLNTKTLQVFNIASNQLQGSIQSNAFENLTQLLTLDLSGNQFIGEIPTQFLNTKTLQVFNIASNQLQGSIQSNAFENLTQLLT
ncbi:unnamed protein product, partial [Sphagnum balticum]